MHEEDPRIADLYEMLQQIEPDDENDTFDEAENEVVANHDDMKVGPMAKLMNCQTCSVLMVSQMELKSCSGVFV